MPFARLLDEELLQYLDDSVVNWNRLEDAARLAADQEWQAIYGQAFVGRPRLRVGAKRNSRIRTKSARIYLIVPLPANVPSVPMSAQRPAIGAYECRGPLVPLGAFCVAEFFVAPLHFDWTMVHTHEDHAFGGPFFVRREWLVRRH
jgi:hypothetical protein